MDIAWKSVVFVCSINYIYLCYCPILVVSQANTVMRQCHSDSRFSLPLFANSCPEQSQRRLYIWQRYQGKQQLQTKSWLFCFTKNTQTLAFTLMLLRDWWAQLDNGGVWFIASIENFFASFEKTVIVDSLIQGINVEHTLARSKNLDKINESICWTLLMSTILCACANDATKHTIMRMRKRSNEMCRRMNRGLGWG